jgi:hypothetical protein
MTVNATDHLAEADKRVMPPVSAVGGRVKAEVLPVR